MSNRGIFAHQTFYIAETEPDKETLISLIEENGGNIAQSFSDNVLWIGTFEFTAHADALVTPRYIHECCEQQSLLPHHTYLKQKPSKGRRSDERRPFSANDKRVLHDWVRRPENFRLRQGDAIYQDLEKLHPHHTADSWKNHWKHNMEPRLTKEQKKQYLTGTGPHETTTTIDFEDDQEQDEEQDTVQRDEQESERESPAILPSGADIRSPIVVTSTPRENEASSSVQSYDGSSNFNETTTTSSRFQRVESNTLYTSEQQLIGDELLQTQGQRHVLRAPTTKKPWTRTLFRGTERSASPTYYPSEINRSPNYSEERQGIFNATDGESCSRKSDKEDDRSATGQGDDDSSIPLLLRRDSRNDIKLPVQVSPSKSPESPDNEYSKSTFEQEREYMVKNLRPPARHESNSVSSSPTNDNGTRNSSTIPFRYSPSPSPRHSTRHALSSEHVRSRRRTEAYDDDWRNGYEQPKRMADAVSSRVRERSYDRYERESKKRSKRHRNETVSSRALSTTSRSPGRTNLRTSNIIDSFAIEEAKHIGMALKQHTYKNISTVTDQAHRRWLTDLRGLIMDSDKEAIQVLTTLRICSGDWEVARAFLMRMKNRGRNDRQTASNYSGQSRIDILMRDKDELTRLMWSQKDDHILLRGSSAQLEELIERKGRNNTSAREQFLQAL